MILLDGNTEKLQIITTAAISIDCYCTWVDLILSPASYTPDNISLNIATATTTDLVAAPASGTRRQIKYISIKNKGASQQTITIMIDVSATDYHLTPAIILDAGETLCYSDGWEVLDSRGRVKANTADYTATGGQSHQVYKVGTASEAIGQWYCLSKDTGSPGAWAVGTPGLGGRATDGTAAADAGAIPVRNPSSGTNYLTGFCATGTTGHYFHLLDIMWINSGLAVTTTTIQNINSVAFPARDDAGTTNGQGVMVGLLCTATAGNAGIVTTITMVYTNSAGVGSKTATMSSFAATNIVGTITWFQLAAGDVGVRSIQSITLGTTLTSGSVSIIAGRTIASTPGLVANIGGNTDLGRGVPLYNGVCLFPTYLSSATTATNFMATLAIESR